MRKLIFSFAISLIASVSAFSQNVQLHYDFGSLFYRSGEKSLLGRPMLTTTVECFKPDNFGSTFFFVDMNYGFGPFHGGGNGVVGAYWEISRELKFWDFPVSCHVEYNGGLDVVNGAYNGAYLFGPTYSYLSQDFSKAFSLSLLYKIIPHNSKRINNFQLTGVWNVSLLSNKFLLSGFFDFWSEHRAWQHTDFIFLSEPQFWYNLNTIPNLEKLNLSVGTEIEISYNFVKPGFYVVPTLALKWTL